MTAIIVYLRKLLLFSTSFGVIVLASRQIGSYFAQLKLPLISGFLFAGILVGPFGLDLITEEAIESLRFVDQVSLAVIAFAAGSELYLQEVRNRMRSIAWVTVGNALIVPVLGMIAIFLLADNIPFMQSMSFGGRFAVAALAGGILIARSPSSVIAIVNELRAKGPFTQTIVGVTMVTDVIVIVVFAVNSEIADALLTNLSFNVGFVALLVGELLFSLLLGYLLGKIIQLILTVNLHRLLKISSILLVGYGTFLFSFAIRDYTHATFSFEVLVEPLLVCMIGSFVVTNFSQHRKELLDLLHEMGPPVYVAFFTLTGAALALDVLADTWLVALTLFAVRLVGIFLGSYGGGMVAGDPPQHNRLSWLAYVTQAGVGLGLAKEVAVEFPTWGTEFATIVISIVVMSQIIGPPMIKWVIGRVGEAHPRGKSGEFDGTRDAIIFGVEDQALAVARQLQAHGWQVKMACHDPDYMEALDNSDVKICPVFETNLEAMEQIGAEKADAVVTMLSDEENYEICSLFYEHYGTQTMVVRLNNRASVGRFHELGALIVEPGTAMVSLLDHLVRSPSAASLLLGMDVNQDIVDIEVRDPNLDGAALRDLRLPLDSLILSVKRDGQTIVSHGFTRLQVGDIVTVMGSPESLDDIMLRFDY